MKITKSNISFTLMIVAFLTVFTKPELVSGSNSNIVEIDIISLNDFHGALVNSGPNDLNPGAARIVQVVLEERAKNPNTLFLAAGDMYMGTALSNLFYGEPVSHMLRLMEVNASAVGNHEFNWGVEQIQYWQKIEQAPFLAANIYEKNTGLPVSWAQPYIVTEFEGVEVGIIGLTTLETLYKTNARNISHLEFKDPVEIAEKYVNILKQEGADIIVLLTHIGSFQDRDTGTITMEEGTEGLTLIEGVDAIITSHSHRAVVGELNGMPIVQGMHNGRALSRINFKFDKDKNKLVETNVYLDLLHERIHYIEENEAMLLLLEPYLEEVTELLGEIIGETSLNMSHSRQELSILGQWAAEVLLEATGADVAFINAGGLRTSIPAGEISMGQLFEVMPFDNSAVVVEMTGTQIKDILEYGIENQDFGFVQFAGIIVEYIPGADEGDKVYSMTLLNGDKVNLDETYLVVTNSFMQDGGDGFSAFLDTKIIKDVGIKRDILIEEIRSNELIEYIPQEILIPIHYQRNIIVEEPSYIQNNTGKIIYNLNEQQSFTTYKVSAGDTLWQISVNNNTTVSELASYNNILNPNLIFVGQIINIPTLSY